LESQQPDGGVWSGMSPLAITSAIAAIQSVTEEYVEEHVDALIADEEGLYETEKVLFAEQEQGKVEHGLSAAYDKDAGIEDDVDKCYKQVPKHLKVVTTTKTKTTTRRKTKARRQARSSFRCKRGHGGKLESPCGRLWRALVG